MEVSGQLHASAALISGTNSGTYSVGGWVGPRVKVKVALNIPIQAQTEEQRRTSTPFNVGATCGWVMKAKPRPLYPQLRPSAAPTVLDAGWAPVLVGTVTWNRQSVALVWIRTTDTAARSQSLYRLRYLGIPLPPSKHPSIITDSNCNGNFQSYSTAAGFTKDAVLAYRIIFS